MEKFAIGFVKWIVLPAAVGAAGFYFVGPMIGKPQTEAVQGQEVEEPQPEAPVEAQVPEPRPTKPKTAEPKPQSKFDPEVPQQPSKPATDDPSIGVHADSHAGTDTIKVEKAPPVASKPKPKARKPAATKMEEGEGDDPASTPSAEKPKPKKPTGDSGPGEDVTTLKPKTPKPKAKPEKKPADLPSTPEEPKDPGGSDGGGI